MPKEIEVFISYAHEDSEYKDHLLKHLALLKRKGIISTWHDRDISAGGELDEQILLHLDSATIILLLISVDFIASDYCFNIEMEHAVKRHKSGLARVIPVILRPVDDWNSLDIGKLNAMPTDAVPISTWDDQDIAFSIVAKGIRKVIDELGLGNGKLPISELPIQFGNWKSYTNHRFGFSIQVPKEWEIGRESDNGDGLELYIGNPMVDIRVYGSFFFQDFSSPYDKIRLPGYRMQRLNLNNGLEAELIIGTLDDKIELDMFQVIGNFEYHFYAFVSREFFIMNETSLFSVIKSFNAMLDGVENIIEHSDS